MLQPRPIRPDDKQALAAGLRRLSPASVYSRFLSPKPAFSVAELRYLTEVDGENHVALVIDDPEHPGELIAVGRWVRLVDDPATAEIAITVADPWQRRGLGSMLARALADEARVRGIGRFSATLSSENTAARRLLEKASSHLSLTHGGGVDDALIELAA